MRSKIAFHSAALAAGRGFASAKILFPTDAFFICRSETRDPDYPDYLVWWRETEDRELRIKKFHYVGVPEKTPWQ